jgi:hypothetical protein
MIEQDKKDAEQKELQDQLRELMATAEVHQQNINKAVEGLKQAARGTVSIVHFKDLRTALASFTEARGSFEKAKKLIKARLQSELKED